MSVETNLPWYLVKLYNCGDLNVPALTVEEATLFKFLSLHCFAGMLQV
jgi:hypothetical protein